MLDGHRKKRHGENGANPSCIIKKNVWTIKGILIETIVWPVDKIRYFISDNKVNKSRD